jgi:hypothetical protein
MSTMPPQSQLEFLRSIDTPTVCNLLEIVAPERRGFGYTVRHLHCIFPDLPPMVGFAKTATMRAQDRVPLSEASYMAKRLDYLDYVAAAPQPSIAVIQDLDDIVGFGAFWGEVQRATCTRRSAASAPSPTVRCATFRRSRPDFRCSSYRSRLRTRSCMWWISG